MCGRCAALAGGKPTTGQRWPEGRRAALFCRRLRRMVVVGHLHFIWFASGCSRRPCWAASDGSRRGEDERLSNLTQRRSLPPAIAGGSGVRLPSGCPVDYYLLAARCDKVRQRQRQQQPQQCMPARWPPACLARASCLHAVLVLSGMCARMAVGCDGGVLWAHSAVRRASAARAGGRDAPHCLSCACVRHRYGFGAYAGAWCRRVGPTEPSV